MTPDLAKQATARAALSLVEDGMRLGLGTGSTASHFVRFLGEEVAAGLNVTGVPTSEATFALAQEAGVPLTTLDETPELDLCIDGADEIDPALNLIKGGGGALLREKIVANASARLVVIADGSKLCDTLGGFGLPIEILPFGSSATLIAIEKVAASLGVSGELKCRMVGNDPYVTENGNLIFDADYTSIRHPVVLASELSAVPGVVEHGLFVGMAEQAIIAQNGAVEILKRQRR